MGGAVYEQSPPPPAAAAADEAEQELELEQLQLLFSVQWGRLLAAAATVLLTTLEDAVWLVPLVVRAASRSIAIVHAVAFVLTFALLSLSVGLVTTLLLRQAQVEHLEHQDVFLSGAGAALCWLIAAFLYGRDVWRRRRRRQRREELQRRRSEAQTVALFAPVDSTRAIVAAERLAYGSTAVENQDDDDDQDDDNENENDDRSEGDSNNSNQLQIWLVVSLTIVGAIDEVSYFPALIVGQVFSVAELTLGTALASLLILFIVCVALAPCGPVLACLDRVPLYAVIVFFAVLLTLNAAWQFAGEWDTRR